MTKKINLEKSDLGNLFEELESIAKETKLEKKKPKDYVEKINTKQNKSDIASLFENLENIAKEVGIKEKKSKDQFKATKNDLLDLFEDLEKVSKQTKKINTEDKNNLNEFINLFQTTNEDYPEDLPSDVEPKPESKPEKEYEEPPEDDPTDDVSDKGSLGGWIEKKVDKQPKDIVEKIVDSLDEIRYDGELKEETNEIESLRKEIENFKRKIAKDVSRAEQRSISNSGGGAGFLGDLDDVDAGTVKIDGQFIRFNETTGTFIGASVDTEDLILEDGNALLLDGTNENSLNSGNRIDLEDGTFAAIDLSSISEDIIPDQNDVRSLGSSNKRFKDLFLSGQTINLGGATISSDGTGSVTVSADGVTLPQGSKVVSELITTETRKIATAGDNGQSSVDVPFFSRAGGTATANKIFKFQSKGLSYVYSDSGTFTLRSGVSLEAQNPQIFTF